jgi:hypothetical protein
MPGCTPSRRLWLRRLRPDIPGSLARYDKVIQHSYVKHLDLLPGSVLSDPKKKHVTIRCFPENPTIKRHLEAWLLIGLNDERKFALPARAGWCRKVGRRDFMRCPPLWQDVLEPEDSEPRPVSIAADESARGLVSPTA